jgi:hypothetical protein
VQPISYARHQFPPEDIRHAFWLYDRGVIALDDPRVAADMLRGMVVVEPQRAVKLGQRGAPDVEEIAARARMRANLFLTGCHPDRVTAMSLPA